MAEEFLRLIQHVLPSSHLFLSKIFSFSFSHVVVEPSPVLKPCWGSGDRNDTGPAPDLRERVGLIWKQGHRSQYDEVDGECMGRNKEMDCKSRRALERRRHSACLALEEPWNSGKNWDGPHPNRVIDYKSTVAQHSEARCLEGQAGRQWVLRALKC